MKEKCNEEGAQKNIKNFRGMRKSARKKTKENVWTTLAKEDAGISEKGSNTVEKKGKEDWTTVHNGRKARLQWRRKDICCSAV